jgi:hypothetical protein
MKDWLTGVMHDRRIVSQFSQFPIQKKKQRRRLQVPVLEIESLERKEISEGSRNESEN